MAPVKLYVYDLSNGMAKALSLQLTGRQIDGIWHTSVVVFGKEVFYGQGISTTLPGKSHHGSPLQVINMGETALDEETFNEYIHDMRSHYTADKYHLLEFNCNSFTNDVVGFLTGGEIPNFIKNLPSDFLSTPFGQALRPTIDQMYRGGSGPGAGANGALSQPQLSSALLQSVANQAAGPPSSPIQALSSPLHLASNTASFSALLASHRAVVAYFTSQSCPPCRVIGPIFEKIAEEKGIPANGATTKKGPAFTKIDMDIGMGNVVSSQFGVTSSPTFLFFKDGQKVGELRGADQAALRSEVDLLIYTTYPPHPHTSLSLPKLQKMSLKPILFTQVPPLDSLSSKLLAAIPAQSGQVKDVAAGFIHWVKARFVSSGEGPAGSSPLTTTIQSWVKATTSLVNVLPLESIFPLVDLWRLAVLDPAVASWISTQPPSTPDPFKLFIHQYCKHPATPPKAYSLTLLRLLCNSFSSEVLCQALMARREGLTNILVSSLLSPELAVRTAGASLAFNSTVAIQAARVADVKTSMGYIAISPGEVQVHADNDTDEDWHVEMVSAIVEALRSEENGDVAHRLVASLGCLLRLSPFGEAGINPLLDVLAAKQVVERQTRSVKDEVKELALDVTKLF